MKADELKKIRADLRITRKQLAEYLEITETTIYNYEKGVYKIPKVVDISLNWYLLHQTGESKDFEKYL